jgi:hypothetical protein
VPDHRTRVIQVRFTSQPDPRNHGAQIRFAVVILYPPEVKRQLATLEAATRRAIDLTREIICRECYHPPDLGALACNVEVTMFDLRPFREVAWIQEDGTEVWIVESERPLPYGWVWRREGRGKGSGRGTSSASWGQTFPLPWSAVGRGASIGQISANLLCLLDLAAAVCALARLAFSFL